MCLLVAVEPIQVNVALRDLIPTVVYIPALDLPAKHILVKQEGDYFFIVPEVFDLTGRMEFLGAVVFILWTRHPYFDGWEFFKCDCKQYVLLHIVHHTNQFKHIHCQTLSDFFCGITSPNAFLMRQIAIGQ